MTTAELLRIAAETRTQGPRQDLYLQAADELDQRDDTIAQLRAERDALARERDRLRKIVEDFEALVGGSIGVYGYHLNGDPSPWSEILQGGRFECIGDIEAALKGETSENP